MGETLMSTNRKERHGIIVGKGGHEHETRRVSSIINMEGTIEVQKAVIELENHGLVFTILRVGKNISLHLVARALILEKVQNMTLIG
ncbi:hypothetical protein ACHQM5_019506 [Ranunculus cassubicifolius]